MSDAVIVAAVRTPVGKRNGGLSGVHPVDLSAHVLNALAERAGVNPEVVDDVIWGCVSQVGEQTFDIARNAVLAAGWPLSVPGVTVDRQCGSSQQSVHFAAAGLVSGQYDVVVAGGVESMSRVPMGSSIGTQPGVNPSGSGLHTVFHDVFPNQGIGAEMMVERWGFTRTQLDEYSLASHAKAAAAIDEGRFAGQITPVKLEDGTVIDTDEGVRRGGTLESMATLKPAFKKPDGTIHAGNSSQISDGSAALLMMTSEKARRARPDPAGPGAHRRPRRRRPGDHAHRPDPRHQEGAQEERPDGRRHRRLRGQRGVLAGPPRLADRDRRRPGQLNPNGGAIALGHPLGGSGARIMTTMVHHMVDNGLRYGLQTMCEGGGQANATILEFLGISWLAGGPFGDTP